jgi:uncharacterized protein
MAEIAVKLGGETFHAALDGTLFHAASRSLIAADLHLEKGSFFAMRRQMLPPYDSAATLAKLGRAVLRTKPERLLLLGDSFHDEKGVERLSADCVEAIAALARLCEIHFITGNHDKTLPDDLPGTILPETRLGDIALRHEAIGEGIEVAGHLHPAALVITPRGTLRRRCFALSRETLILPAFGAYTGGLNIRDRAFAQAFRGDTPHALVMGDTRLFSIPPPRLLPDRRA